MAGPSGAAGSAVIHRVRDDRGLVALIGHAVLSWSERRELAQRAEELEGQLASIEGTLDQQMAINRDQDVAIATIGNGTGFTLMIVLSC